MKTPPTDLDPDVVAAALGSAWGIDVETVEYAPLGFGSHHWRARSASGDQWFVTVDDLHAAHLAPEAERSFRLLDTAFEVATSLRNEAGLDFVISPLPARSGVRLLRLTERYSMALFPHLDVVPGEFGRFQTEEDRVGALGLIGQVHSVKGQLAVQRLRQDTLVIPGRKRLEAALRDVDAPWDGGPYAERGRDLLREQVSGVRKALVAFDELVDLVTADNSGWVISHGEPHAGNILRTVEGEQVFVDWDTVAFAPPERDLRMLIHDDAPDLSAYREITGLDAISQIAMEAYRLHWDLSEIAIYLQWCRMPHEDAKEMRIDWRELQSLLGVTGG